MASSSSSGNRAPRLIVVSNRLPITIALDAPGVGNEPGKYSFKRSSGGLVSAFSGLGMEFKWIGWPDFHPSLKDKNLLEDTLLSKYKSVPVWLDQTLVTGYYNGFSNSVLWPLFHNYPGEIPIKKEYWEYYQKANSLFADAITAQLQDGDIVWIQDYHLMLVPQMLRERNTKKNVKIGWFLHTPFPDYEEYRKLSVRNEILKGVLHADLVGFHKPDYARNFVGSCKDILNLKANVEKVEFDGRYAYIGSFPIGIDPEIYTKSLQDTNVINGIRKRKEEFKDLKIILGIDRLDYIKGIPEKLLAMEAFLTEHPEWVGKVVLVQIAVPSREGVKEYQDLRTSVDEIAERINKKYGNYKPIRLWHIRVGHEDLVALYAASDVCLVTSTRDGMNLVSLEYIASQQTNHGVLILSEFAGAADSLPGSLVVNPWNENATVNAIYEALTMSVETRRDKFNRNWSHVKKNTAARWGENFVKQLKTEKKDILIAPLSVESVLEAFKKSSKKVILLDYDDMLTAIPSKEVLKELKALTSKRDTYVYLMSGHSRQYLKTLIDTTGVGLIAEYGCFYKHPSLVGDKAFTIHKEDGGWRRLAKEVDPKWKWKEAILPIFQRYTNNTPNSSIEDKEINLAWEYRNVHQDLSGMQVSELEAEIKKLPDFKKLAIVPSDKSFDLRPAIIDKLIMSKAVNAIREDLNATSDVDFILCVGDGKTDEEVFSVLKKITKGHVFTSTIGIFSPGKPKQTEAKSYVKNFDDVRNLMSKLV